MNFANFSWPWVIAGLTALAGLLYVLQHLRVRYREVTVASTLLWRMAVQEAPVRKFWQHFRHPWAYLLILLICSLLWLGLAEPQWNRPSGGEFHVLVLDGSAGMAAGHRYEDAVAALKKQVGTLPADRRQVLWVGAEVRTLLNPGEDEVLLQKRLQGLQPQATPARIEQLVGELAIVRHTAQTTAVLIFGDAPVSQTLLDSLPGNLSVKRAQAVESMAHNAGITALGVSDAQSGAWDKVDVFIQAQDNEGQALEPNDLQIQLEGKQLPDTPLQWATTDRRDGLLLKDLPAQGGVLTVQLPADDALALDNLASIRLPAKPFLKVQLSASLDSALRAVLQADPAVQITDVDPALVIRRQGETTSGNLPALEFVNARDQTPAFLLTYPEGLDAEGVFAKAVDDIGLRQIDAMALADAAQRPIEVTMRAGEQWRLSVWQELLGEDFNFTRSRSFPLFVANAVRWLAGWHATYPYAAAGQPLLADSLDRSAHVLDPQGRAIDPLGVPFVPEQAGELLLAGGGKSLFAALLDAPTTTAESDSLGIAQAGPLGGATHARVLTWLTMLALLLLVVEWHLHRNGRMP